MALLDRRLTIKTSYHNGLQNRSNVYAEATTGIWAKRMPGQQTDYVPVGTGDGLVYLSRWLVRFDASLLSNTYPLPDDAPNNATGTIRWRRIVDPETGEEHTIENIARTGRGPSRRPYLEIAAQKTLVLSV